MHLENLSKVHTAWHTERRKNEIDWIAVFVIGHVLDREHARDDTLVAVTPRELVADRNIAHLCNRDDDLLMIPVSSSSPFSREKTRTPMTRPRLPPSIRRLVSFTSFALSPKILRSKRSSGVSCVSPFGVTLPTRISPGALLLRCE